MGIDYISLGKNIKKQRALAKMTQVQLAEIVECSDRHIGQIENAKNIPSLAMTVSIANALNVGVDQLLYAGLDNPSDYYIQEFLSITDGFEPKEKRMVIDLMKAIAAVLKESQE